MIDLTYDLLDKSTEPQTPPDPNTGGETLDLTTDLLKTDWQAPTPPPTHDAAYYQNYADQLPEPTPAPTVEDPNVHLLGMSFLPEIDRDTPVIGGFSKAFQDITNPTTPDYMTGGEVANPFDNWKPTAIRDLPVIGGVTRIAELIPNLFGQEFETLGKPLTGLGALGIKSLFGEATQAIGGTPMDTQIEEARKATGYTPDQIEADPLGFIRKAGEQQFEGMPAISQFGLSILFDPATHIPNINPIRRFQEGRTITELTDVAELAKKSDLASLWNLRAIGMAGETGETLASDAKLFRQMGKLESVLPMGKPNLTRATAMAQETGHLLLDSVMAQKDAATAFSVTDSLLQARTDLNKLRDLRMPASVRAQRMVRLLDGAEPEVEAVQNFFLKAGEAVLAGDNLVAEEYTKAPKAIQEFVKAATGSGWSKDKLAAELDEAARTGLGEVLRGTVNKNLVDIYHLTPPNGIERMFNAVKNVEAILFMGLNPVSLVRNVLNNKATMLSEGLDAFAKPSQYEPFLKSLGISKKMLEDTLRAGGELRSMTGRELFGAGMGGGLTKTRGSLSGKIAKLGEDYTLLKAYQAFEEKDRFLSFVSGMQRAAQTNMRVGKFIREMDPSISAQLDDTQLKHLYNLVESNALNPNFEQVVTQNLTDVLDGKFTPTVRDYTEALGAALGGLSEDEVLQALNVNFEARLNQTLKTISDEAVAGNLTPEALRKVANREFARVAQEVADHIDAVGHTQRVRSQVLVQMRTAMTDAGIPLEQADFVTRVVNARARAAVINGEAPSADAYLGKRWGEWQAVKVPRYTNPPEAVLDTLRDNVRREAAAVPAEATFKFGPAVRGPKDLEWDADRRYTTVHRIIDAKNRYEAPVKLQGVQKVEGLPIPKDGFHIITDKRTEFKNVKYYVPDKLPTKDFYHYVPYLYPTKSEAGMYGIRARNTREYADVLKGSQETWDAGMQTFLKNLGRESKGQPWIEHVVEWQQEEAEGLFWKIAQGQYARPIGRTGTWDEDLMLSRVRDADRIIRMITDGERGLDFARLGTKPSQEWLQSFNDNSNRMFRTGRARPTTDKAGWETPTPVTRSVDAAPVAAKVEPELTAAPKPKIEAAPELKPTAEQPPVQAPTPKVEPAPKVEPKPEPKAEPAPAPKVEPPVAPTVDAEKAAWQKELNQARKDLLQVTRKGTDEQIAAAKTRVQELQAKLQSSPPGPFHEQATDLRKDWFEMPEFKTWFGDSKVVDEAGMPKRVYHGTNTATSNTFMENLRGSLGFDAEGKAFVHLFGGKADVWTAVHEVFHGFMDDLKTDQLDILAKATGSTKTGEDLRELLDAAHGSSVIDRELRRISEDWANMGVNYLRSGETPSPELVPIFEKFKVWLTQVWSALRGEKQVPEAIRKVMDNLLAGTEPEYQAAVARLGGASVPSANPLITQANLSHEWAKANGDLFLKIAEPLRDSVLAEMQTGRSPLSPHLAQSIRDYLTQARGDIVEGRQALLSAGRWAEKMAVLDYTDRYNFDTWTSFYAPFWFWRIHSGINWAQRFIDRPAQAAFYLHALNELQDTNGDPSIPTRLQGTLQFPMPFLPDWMGKSVFVNPITSLVPLNDIFLREAQTSKFGAVTDNQIAALIRTMQSRNEIDDLSAETALTTKKGTLWQMVKDKLVADMSNPLSSTTDLMQPHLPTQILSALWRGQPEDISVAMPLTRLIKGATALAGVNDGKGINIEEPYKQALRRLFGTEDIPLYDAYDLYRTERAIRDGVASGQYKEREALRALMEHSGTVWDDAAAKAAQQQAVPNLTSGFARVDIFPKGERQYYVDTTIRVKVMDAEAAKIGVPPTATYDEKLKALKAAGLTKKGTPFGDIYDAYPDLSVTTELFKTQEGRLKYWLDQEVRDLYWDLNALDKRVVRAQLGSAFENYVNNGKYKPDGMSYAEWLKSGILPMPIKTLAQWTQTLGGYVPKPQGIAPINVALDKQYIQQNPAFVRAYDEYVKKIDKFGGNQLFVDQTAYFALPEHSPERRAFLVEHPNLQPYWTWKREWEQQNPQLAKMLDSLSSSPPSAGAGATSSSTPPSTAAAPVAPRPVSSGRGGSGGNGPVAGYIKPTTFASAAAPTAASGLMWSKFPPTLLAKMDRYFAGQYPLNVTDIQQLMALWRADSRGAKTLQDWLNMLRSARLPKTTSYSRTTTGGKY